MGWGWSGGTKEGAHTVSGWDMMVAGAVRRELGLQHGWGATSEPAEPTWS